MGDSQTLIYKSLGLYEKHIKLLEGYNENQNLAARMAFDELIRNHNKQDKQKKIDAFNNSIIIIALGLIFFIFMVISTNQITSILSLLIGVFLCIVGTINMVVKIYAL